MGAIVFSSFKQQQKNSTHMFHHSMVFSFYFRWYTFICASPCPHCTAHENHPWLSFVCNTNTGRQKVTDSRIKNRKVLSVLFQLYSQSGCLKIWESDSKNVFITKWMNAKNEEKENWKCARLCMLFRLFYESTVVLHETLRYSSAIFFSLFRKILLSAKSNRILFFFCKFNRHSAFTARLNNIFESHTNWTTEKERERLRKNENETKWAI